MITRRGAAHMLVTRVPIINIQRDLTTSPVVALMAYSFTIIVSCFNRSPIDLSMMIILPIDGPSHTQMSPSIQESTDAGPRNVSNPATIAIANRPITKHMTRSICLRCMVGDVDCVNMTENTNVMRTVLEILSILPKVIRKDSRTSIAP